jgi:hypothetical protein
MTQSPLPILRRPAPDRWRFWVLHLLHSTGRVIDATRSYSQIQAVKLNGPRDGCASRTSTISGAKRTNVACFTGGGVGDEHLRSSIITNTYAPLLFPEATIGNVTLITRIQFGGGQKPKGRRPNPKAAVSAMLVVSVKAKARTPAIFMAIIPVQRRLGDSAWWNAKQTIAIAVKYPMKSAAIAISSITSAATLQRSCKNKRKAVPFVTIEIGGEVELFPAHSCQRLNV